MVNTRGITIVFNRLIVYPALVINVVEVKCNALSLLNTLGLKNMYTLKVKLAFSLIKDFNVPAVSRTNNQFHAMKLLTCNI